MTEQETTRVLLHILGKDGSQIRRGEKGRVHRNCLFDVFNTRIFENMILTRCILRKKLM